MTELLVEAENTELLRHEKTIEQGLKTFVDVGNALLAIRDKRLYRQDFGTFEDYCQERWGFKRSYAYEIMDAAAAVKTIEMSGIPDIGRPGTVSQARPLTRLEPELQATAWQRAVETAPNGKVTAAHVENVARAFVTPPAATVRLEPRPADNYAPPSGYRFVPAVAPEESAEVFPETSNHMAIHYSSETPEHYTPKEIIDAAVALLGAIDLDPCSNSKGRPNVPALAHFTVVDDGLSVPWFGRVYMNPPYGRVIGDWTGKLIDEYESGNVTEAIALVPGRIDTQWWQAMGRYPACFVTGRLTFIGNDDPAPFPSTVFYFGKNMSRFCEVFSSLGQIWARVNEAHHDL